YSPRALESTLAQYFGNTQLKTALTPLLVSSYDLHGQQPFFFKSHVIAAYPNWNWPVVQVARATSAAPTFFPTLRLQERTQARNAEQTERDSSPARRDQHDRGRGDPSDGRTYVLADGG